MFFLFQTKFLFEMFKIQKKLTFFLPNLESLPNPELCQAVWSQFLVTMSALLQAHSSADMSLHQPNTAGTTVAKIICYIVIKLVIVFPSN